jgi:bacillithiol system protein YtxJ
MKWNELNALDQLQVIKEESIERPVLIFKHSTRCNISRTTLDRLERHWNDQEMARVKPYFLDLLSHREISTSLADQFNVEHASPQVLLIDKGQSILDLSHFEIDYQEIKSVINN